MIRENEPFCEAARSSRENTHPESTIIEVAGEIFQPGSRTEN